MKEIKRGEIYAVDFGTGFGSEQGGTRPSLILQNDIGNRHSPTTIVAAITGRKTKAALKNRPMEYDDQIIRQLLECIVVDSKEQITVIFKGGLKSVQPLTE